MKKSANKKPATVEAYIESFPKEVQQRLQQIRKIILASAPEVEESMSYGMPAYKHTGKPLVYFAGYEKHIGFYATPTGHAAFKNELSKYKLGKGSVQFPFEKPLPLKLIKNIVLFRVKENEQKNSEKKKAKKVDDAETVTAYMEQLRHPLKPEVETIRTIIKKAGKSLKERIKWNAPSYYAKEDMITFNLFDKKAIRLIFHHPTIVQINSRLLEGNFKDRRVLYIRNSEELAAHKKELERIIKEQVNLVGK